MRWRPSQSIRAVAVALIYRGADVLVTAVKDDSGSIKGWRPLGGAIEFGESAEEAVAREFLEETGSPIRCIKQLCALENLYTHEGSRGHEIVFAFEAVSSEPDLQNGSSFLDGGVSNEAAWRPVREFAAGVQRLFPEKLAAYLDVAGALRREMNADLRFALKAKDATAISALRSVMAALDNASAVPIGTVAAPVFGRSGDVPRKDLSAADCQAIIIAEVRARAVAAEEYARLGQGDAAARLRAEQAVIERYIQAG